MSSAVIPADLVPNWLGDDEVLPGDIYNIAAALKEYDPNLCVGVNGLTGKYEIYYVSARLGNNPELIHTVENPDGSWRPLDGRVIKHLHRNDTRHEGNSWRAYVKAREAERANREQYLRDLYANLREDAATAFEVSGPHRTRFYMHRPTSRARTKLKIAR
jgi:hypothetical protein